ncbi:MAG: hypothetical protein GWQ05_11375 [Verrucomicrobiaceae bacterium]|nr:hypothetical protein [Verrucomicrobiaceae bacterium]
MISCLGHPNHQLDLTYMTPGKTWENDGLPIGNGYFGALVLGGISEDRIRLTDPSLRDEGGRVLPLADLVIATGHEPENARTFLRRLDLQTAAVEVSYRDGRLRHRREYFASYPDRVLVGRLRAVRKGSLNLSLSWKSPQEGAAVTYDARTRRFGISGVGFEAQVEVRLVGGTLTNKGADGIRIEGVNEVALILTVSQGETFAAGEHLNVLKEKEARVLFQNHISDYQDQFHAMYVTLEGGAKSNLETAKRRLLYAEKPEEDPGFEELLFQYGRYLYLSSARPGSVAPPHGRGIWWFTPKEETPLDNRVLTGGLAALIQPAYPNDPMNWENALPWLDEPGSALGHVSHLFMEATKGRSDEAYGQFRKLLQSYLTDNLLTTDQNIAANMSLVRGVRKLFAEEKEGVLHLANNLPKHWSDGSIVGMRTHNFEIAYVWQDGKFFEGYLTRQAAGRASLKTKARLLWDRFGDDEVIRLTPDSDGLVHFSMEGEKTMRLRLANEEN